MKLKKIVYLSTPFVIAHLLTTDLFATNAAGVDSIIAGPYMRLLDADYIVSEGEDAKSKLGAAVEKTKENAEGIGAIVVDHARTEAEKGAQLGKEETTDHPSIQKGFEDVQKAQDAAHEAFRRATRVEGTEKDTQELPASHTFRRMGQTLIDDHAEFNAAARRVGVRCLVMGRNVAALNGRAPVEHYNAVLAQVQKVHSAQENLVHGAGGMKSHHHKKHSKVEK